MKINEKSHIYLYIHFTYVRFLYEQFYSSKVYGYESELHGLWADGGYPEKKFKCRITAAIVLVHKRREAFWAVKGAGWGKLGLVVPVFRAYLVSSCYFSLLLGLNVPLESS